MDVSRWKRRENTWFVVVVAALVAAVAVTIFQTPWNASAKADRQIVKVVAQQYGFTFSTDKVAANRQVEFRLHAVDVNHAFAIFDPSGTMVAQAQMMPDWDSTLRVTLTKPGRYAVRCFEYCGIGHHTMITQLHGGFMTAIDVTAPAFARSPEYALTAEELRVRTQRLVLRYVLTSTALLFVGGALGVVLRQSQADLVTVSPTVWYELMTAHGLATFVGWAAFCLMGHVLLGAAGVRLPDSRLGLPLGRDVVVDDGARRHRHRHHGARAAFRRLVGVPLPAAVQPGASGEWSDGTTALFSASVLVVGLSIFTYCFGMLAIVTGTELGARPGSGFGHRTLCALGFGYLRPQRWHTERPLPYAVIPLTVIGIDMIIATTPLAVLLVIMIAQSIDPSVSVDPLLAKTMLWWFGHPVVYLLLFPAVAIYYHLIPKLAQRELVAGHIIAVAWTIAVISNVIIGAHHMYTDFPESIQQSVNTFTQPLTYAVTIPSAISLFSLGFTIYRSAFDWTAPAAKFLAVALVSWLVAGLQGVGLATIEYDAVAHNTLWVVGHFHNMALIHIGMVIFAASTRSCRPSPAAPGTRSGWPTGISR